MECVCVRMVCFATMVNPCIDNNADRRFSGVRALVDASTARLAKAQQYSEQHYIFALYSMFEKLLSSLFKAKGSRENASGKGTSAAAGRHRTRTFGKGSVS